MPISERLKRGAREAQKAGILKEPYQSMTEEELFTALEERLAEIEKTRSYTGTNNRQPN